MEGDAVHSAADWLAEGDAHYDAQRWNDAGPAYERALAIDPRQARAWYRLGNVREEQGRDGDAVSCFDKAVALDPSNAQAWNNLGGARQRLGREEQAIAAYRRAMAADPLLPQPCLNLGRLAGTRGDHALAAECFKTGLAHHPGDPTFEHLVAAAEGNNTARAPDTYVTTLFDGLAPRFEQHLVQDLEYHVPEALAKLVLPDLLTARNAGKRARVIDLGCGTGLVGVALAAADAELIGIDLSPRMLEIAATRGAYARLELGELLAVLARMPALSAQAVLAADVFIYVGNLEAVFAQAARVLAPGGLFAMSVEKLDDGSYQLRPTGRYAQSAAYLRTLAAQSGLQERGIERARIRREGRVHVEGWIALFAKAHGAAKPTAA
ncbi:MAG TPA: tetratricopeptide repeat protein [Burkholderiales bacterium]|nr:tetratricopeptide repeat protein [Burkholderiales bacterium]